MRINTMLQDSLTAKAVAKINDSEITVNGNTITAVKAGNNVLSDGVQVTTWDYHLCITGGYGSYLFKSSTAKDLGTLFLSDTANYEYLAGKLATTADITDRFKFSCQLAATLLATQ